MSGRREEASQPPAAAGRELGKHIVLGVCGSIAAYKAVEVCRRLVEAGAHVVPVMTADAERFVGAVTFSALASEPAHTSMWADSHTVPHVSMGRAADVVVVAPATARLLGLYANGIAADLLLSTLLATSAPVVVCPAMHTEMWEHPATQANVATLRERGVTFVGPASGPLAGGDEGAGRFADLADIVLAVEQVLRPRDLAGRRVLVTAGGTREPVDPVRFLGNRSSGRQGEAVAVEAAARGAEVTLVTAAERPAPPGMNVVRVSTAAEMERAVTAAWPSVDAVVMAAAVADFRPKQATDQKLRSDHGPPDLVLEPTSDILAGLARSRRDGQVLIGFAAETQDLRERALDKLKRKGVDAMVANDVSRADVGFGHDTNAVLIVEAGGHEQEVALTSKREVAVAVVDVLARRLPVVRESTDDLAGQGRQL